jgi:dolichol-phosphate mannosyltransferase
MVSGGVVMAAYYAPYYLLTEFCGVWYLVSSIVGSITSSVTNFVLQKYWTFENKSVEKMHRQVIEFTLVSVAIAGANTGMLYILVGKLHVHYLLAQMVVTGILCIASYFIVGWVFRENEP